MDIIKIIAQKRGLSFIFIVAAFALSTAVFIVYLTTGANEFTPELSGVVVALFAVQAVLAAVLCVFEFKYGKYALYLLGLLVWLEYFSTQINYVANVFTAIDGTSFSAGFILTVMFGLLAFAASLVSAILQKRLLGSARLTHETERR